MTIIGWIQKPKVELRTVEDYARAAVKLNDHLVDQGFVSYQISELLKLAEKDLDFRGQACRWCDKDPNLD